MKLIKLLQDIFKNGPIKHADGKLDYKLSGTQLMLWYDKLQECDEFKDCELHITNELSVKNDKGEEKFCKTRIMHRGIEFKGIVYLHSITLTPQVWNLNKLQNYKAIITPLAYNENLEPTKIISLSFNPEQIQDALVLKTEEDVRKELHDLLDKVLDNPENYKLPSERGILLQCIGDYKDGGYGAGNETLTLTLEN